MKRAAWLFFLIATVATGTLMADHGWGRGGPHGRAIFIDGRGSGLPPGLAKRGGDLPPGLQRHIERTGHLPPGLEKRRAPIFFGRPFFDNRPVFVDRDDRVLRRRLREERRERERRHFFRTHHRDHDRDDRW